MKKKFWSDLDKDESSDLIVQLFGIWGEKEVEQDRKWKVFLENQISNTVEFDYNTQVLRLFHTVDNRLRKIIKQKISLELK